MLSGIGGGKSSMQKKRDLVSFHQWKQFTICVLEMAGLEPTPPHSQEYGYAALTTKPEGTSECVCGIKSKTQVTRVDSAAENDDSPLMKICMGRCCDGNSLRAVRSKDAKLEAWRKASLQDNQNCGEG